MRRVSIILFSLILLLFPGCQSNDKKGFFDLEDKIILNEIKRIKSLENTSERLKKIDSLYHILNQKATIDSLQLYVLYEKSNHHFGIQQIDSSYYYDHLLLKQSDSTGINFFSGKARQGIAYFFKRKNEYDSAYYYYNTSKNFFQKIKDSSSTGRCLMNMGLIQKNQNDFFGSKETLVEALKYLNPNKDGKHIASCYNILGTNHRKLGNLEDAIHYYSEASNLTNSDKEKLRYNNNLAAALMDSKEYQNAEILLNDILADSVLKKKSSQYARVFDNLTYAQWRYGKKIKAKDFLIPLRIRKQNNDRRGQIASYTHLGEYYSKTNPKRAEAYFDSVIQLSKTLKIPRAEKDALKFLMKLKPKNVNLRDRYVLLQDSLYAQELKVKTQFAKYKYDDKLKQESILRLEKENAEKELEASQQRNQKILYLGGLLFITSVLGLSLYGFRQRTKRLKQKSKAEKLEAVHETEAGLSQKLHDDHGGKLNQVMLLIQRGADKEVILNKIEEIYNNTRDFSRDLNSIDTGPNFWKSLKATLEYTKPTEVNMILNGGKELNWLLVGHQTKTILFKVLQELVINMARHSSASQTVILFKDQKKELFVYYEDDGVGASKESLLRKNGLRNTEKRIQAIGGSITFDSEEGKGFRAEIRTPK